MTNVNKHDIDKSIRDFKVPDLSDLPSFDKNAEKPYSFSAEEEQGELLDNAHLEREVIRSFLISGERQGFRGWLKHHIKALVLASIALALLLGAFIYRGDLTTWFSTLEQDVAAQSGQEHPSQKQEADAEGIPVTEEANQDISLSERLASYYKGLGAYNKRVNDAVDNFNSYYLSKKVKREEQAQSALELQERIGKARSLLQELMTNPSENMQPDQHAYAQCMYDALALLEERITLINECWSIDLSFGNPKEHKDSILEPLRTKSLKKLKNEFNKLYEKAEGYNKK